MVFGSKNILDLAVFMCIYTLFAWYAITCASTLALSTIVLESAIRPLIAQP